jgi:predicted nucleotidyltransferase
MGKDILIELKDGIERLLGTGRARLILYGSRARGDYDRKSDISNLVLALRGSTNALKHLIKD